MLPLSIVTLGHVHAEDLEPLTHHFTRLEQLVLDINPRDPLARHRAEFHRAVDAATSDWVLVIREREKATEILAEEIAHRIEVPEARAFRIATVVLYAGLPLHIRQGESEVRLFDKRRLLRGGAEVIAVDGGEQTLANSFTSATFESVEAHREELAKSGAVRRSAIRRTLVFVRDVVALGTTDRNTLSYIWTEAGFERS